jgi:alpha-L-fucosidase
MASPYGEAIYGTRKRNTPSEETGGQKVFYTGKDKNIYAVFSTWPQQALQLNLEKGITVSAVSILGLNRKIDWKQEGEKLSIMLPACTVNKLPSFDAWSLKIVTE